MEVENKEEFLVFFATYYVCKLGIFADWIL